ncbi:hypothetical protein BC831DRAFT_100803 [Entophlyctis helioformis]|nr:hypothetical protein BC831DRAFT_100803 [Entophlyctis helioformis]
MSLKAVVRNVKNVTKGYSDLQIKVRQATCNDAAVYLHDGPPACVSVSLASLPWSSLPPSFLPIIAWSLAPLQRPPYLSPYMHTRQPRSDSVVQWGPSGALMAEISDCTYNQRDFQEIMEVLNRRLNDSGKNWRHVFKALTVYDYLIKNGSEAVIANAKQNLHAIKTLKEFQYIDDDGRDQGANVRQKSKDITALLADDARLQEERGNRGNVRSRMNYHAGEGSGGFSEDADLRRALEESKRQAAIDDRRRKDMEQEDADLQRAIELSEKEAIQRRMDARNRLEPQMTGDSTFSGPARNDIIDLFSSIEQPAPQPFQQQQVAFDPFAGFGGFDPFQQQQQQQQQMLQQQLLQQQMLQQQQQQQQLLLQQQLQQQQLAQQQQQQQQDFFASLAQTQSNPFAQQQAKPNPFDSLSAGGGSFGASPDLSRNPNSTIDPFASVSTRVNPSGPNNSSNNAPNPAGGFNPFGASSPQPASIPSASSQGQKSLFDLDAPSLASGSSPAPPVNKNPFSSTNSSSRYQWEQPKPKPTLAQLQATSAFTPGTSSSVMMPGQGQGFSPAPLQPALTGSSFGTGASNPFGASVLPSQSTGGMGFGGMGSMQPQLSTASFGGPSSGNAMNSFPGSQLNGMQQQQQQQQQQPFGASAGAPFSNPFAQTTQQPAGNQFFRAN